MKKNTVSHFEIYADNPDALAKFYTQLFDWDVQHMPEMDYRLVKAVDTGADNRPTTPGAINGGIAKRPQGYGVNGSVNYVMVDSIETYVEKRRSSEPRSPRARLPSPAWGGSRCSRTRRVTTSPCSRRISRPNSLICRRGGP